MTFEQLVGRTQRGRVLRARRRGWRDPARYVAVTMLVPHTGARVAGFIGREINGPRVDLAYFGTPALPDADRDDWERCGHA